MPIVTPTKFHCVSADIANGVHNLGSNTLKLVLSNVAPSLGNTILANITQIAAGGGYTTGGFTLTVASSSQVSGNYKLIINDYTFTATGNVADFRYAIAYNDTSPSDSLLFFMDYGSVISGMTTNEQVVFDFDNTNGAIAIPYA